VQGIFKAPMEAGEIGPGLYEAACRMGQEGMISSRYRPRTCDLVNVKNQEHPAFRRVMDALS
jgi:bifunctional non-homologous end joining protein LigD